MVRQVSRVVPKRHSASAMAIALTVGLSACDTGRKFSSGSHLPDGDVEGGRAAFVTLKCDACHRVTGLETFALVTDSPVSAVLLGGNMPYAKPDGELATSTVNSSYTIRTAYHGEGTQGGRPSRMTDYGEAIARHMIGLLAFLQAHYDIGPPTYATR